MKNNANILKPDFSHRYDPMFSDEFGCIDAIEQAANETYSMLQVFANQFVNTESKETDGLNNEINFFALQAIAKNIKDIKSLADARAAVIRAAKEGAA